MKTYTAKDAKNRFGQLIDLENEHGYDDAYMGEVAATLREICTQ